MKKIKLFLVSAAIVAAGSAFIPAAKPLGAIYVKVGSTFVLKSTQTGTCEQMTSSACDYELRQGHSPNTESDFIYSLDENKVWVPE